MTKDVLVSISGLHTDALNMEDREYEPVEVVTPANYFLKNGKHYIIYDEVTEGIPGITKNKIKITGDTSLEIMKSGITNVHMVFEKNKTNLTYYQTPYGQMLIGIHTTSLELETGEDSLRVSVDYRLDVNHQPLAECQVRIHVKSKASGDGILTENMQL